MEALAAGLREFFSFKAYVMLPILIFFIGLGARMRLRMAAFDALKIAAGFAGIFVAFNFFVTRIGPAVQAIARVRGLDFPVMDVGWPPLAAITWAWAFAPLCILAIGLLNALFVALKWTRILYIDIWNYWHFAFIGALFQATGAGLVLSFAAVLLLAALNFKLTEWSVPYVQRETGIEGVGISPLSVAGLLPWAIAMDSFIDLLPGIRRISCNPSASATRGAGLISEPMVIGFGLGVFLGIVAGYPLKAVLEIAVEIAAVMFILPRCGGAIGEAMGDVSTALKTVLERRVGGRGFAIAMDTGVILGNPSVIATGLILMPISLGLAFILPGNRLIPLGDLPNLISIFSLLVLVMRGNVFRAIIAGIPVVAAFMLIASGLAPLFTRLAAGTGMDFGNGSAAMTAFTDGGNPIRWWFLQLKAVDGLALAAILPVGFLLWLSWRGHKKASEELKASDRSRSQPVTTAPTSSAPRR